VEAMHMIVQNDAPSDYVVGTGQAHSIREFCETAFRVVGIDWQDVVVVDKSLLRKVDSHFTHADASKLRTELRWRPEVDFDALVRMMVERRIEFLKAPRLAATADRLTPQGEELNMKGNDS
jgi:GDPmannose 4,6-dehydratase